MKKITFKQLFGAIASLTALMGAQNAHASLVGDEVNAQLSAPGFGTFFNSTQIIGPGVDFNWDNGDGLIDVHDDSFDFTLDISGFQNSQAPITLTLSDLDWVGADGVIVGVSKTSGGPVDSIDFGDDWIQVTVPLVTNPPPQHSWSFDIQARHDGDVVPDAGASALFLSLGLLPIFGAATRKRS